MMPLAFESIFGLLKSVQANDEDFIGLVKVGAIVGGCRGLSPLPCRLDSSINFGVVGPTGASR